MRLLLVFLCMLMSLSYASAQNTMSLNTTQGINFKFQTPLSLESNQTLTNLLTTQAKSNNSSIYVKMHYFNAPGGWSGSTYPVQLDLSSYSSSSGISSLVTSPITLTSSNQNLFGISKNTRTYTMYYDLIYLAPGYTATAGNYNFTLMFTMTQP